MSLFLRDSVCGVRNPAQKAGNLQITSSESEFTEKDTVDRIRIQKKLVLPSNNVYKITLFSLRNSERHTLIFSPIYLNGTVPDVVAEPLQPCQNRLQHKPKLEGEKDSYQAKKLMR
ncbi:hypothetical protein BK125_19595 [Paenibacillus odorifer]|nr:hypothetical protein BK125_19595 [Paenibacillus odorifer]